MRSPGLPRAGDLVLAVVAAAVAAPLGLAIALLVALTSPGPVLFRQLRVGRGGRSFRLLKFRTMRAGAEGPGVTAAGDPRITRVGRRLRRWKLDELPELINVVRGDLALVGPRPEIPRFVDLEDPLWQELLSVRPGLTDPVTLELRDEEGLLARTADGDPERVYREVLLPAKLAGQLAYQRRRRWTSDLAVLARTALRLVRPVPAPELSSLEGRLGVGRRARER